jgi:hypothetical protein
MTEGFLNILTGLLEDPNKASLIYSHAYSALKFAGFNLYPVDRPEDSLLPKQPASILKDEISAAVLQKLKEKPMLLRRAVSNTFRVDFLAKAPLLNRQEISIFKQALKQY